MASSTAAPFDPMEPFARDDVLREVLDGLKTFDYKLYGPSPLRFHRAQPTKYEFDLKPGVASNGERCHGHWMTEPWSLPWHNGPPKWVHVLSRQYTFPPTLNNA